MQVEQLLETYFMNLDNTWNRLQTLAEYVDDTEDYIKFDVRSLWHVYTSMLMLVCRTKSRRGFATIPGGEPCIITALCN